MDRSPTLLWRVRRLLALHSAYALVLGLVVVYSKAGLLDAADLRPETHEFVTGVLQRLGLSLVGLGLVSLMFWDLAPVCNVRRLAGVFVVLHLLQLGLLQLRLLGFEDSRLWSLAQLLFAIFHLGMAIAFFRIARVEKSGDDLAAYEPQARSWLGAGDVAALEERKRLARDLHDSIKQQLFSIKVGAAAAEARWDTDPPGARSALADVRQSAHAAMVEMQALLRQLRPNPLEMVGLVEALREQCEALEFRSGARVELEIGELPTEERLPDGTQEHVFRIAQEALSNVARHARAHHVHVRLATEEDRFLVFDLRDDGQGFLLPSPDAPGPGMGLRNLRERAGALSGSLDLESAPGQGARLEIRLPLSARATPIDPLLDNDRRAVFAVLVLTFINADSAVDSGGPFLVAFAFGLWSYFKIYKAARSAEIGPEWAARLRHLTHPYRFLLFAQAFWSSPWFLETFGKGKDVWGVFGLEVTLVPAVLALAEAGAFLWKERQPGAAASRVCISGEVPARSFKALLVSFILGPLVMLAFAPEDVLRGGGIVVGLLCLTVFFRRWFSGQENPHRPGGRPPRRADSAP